jgi:hypothetical protein
LLKILCLLACIAMLFSNSIATSLGVDKKSLESRRDQS